MRATGLTRYEYLRGIVGTAKTHRHLLHIEVDHLWWPIAMWCDLPDTTP